MKLIILILANDTDKYLEMQNLWILYMKTHNNINVFFIKYTNVLTGNIYINDDIIYIPGYESLVPGCLDKTIKSIEYLLNNNFDFDFIFRTNLSSVVNLQKIYNLLSNNINYAGVIGLYGDTNFASGAGILLSKKYCNFLIENQKKLDYSLIDDVSIGKFLNKINKFEITPLTRHETYNYSNNLNNLSNEIINDYYHFRCKSSLDHTKTIDIMKKIIKLIYNIDA